MWTGTCYVHHKEGSAYVDVTYEEVSIIEPSIAHKAITLKWPQELFLLFNILDA